MTASTVTQDSAQRDLNNLNMPYDIGPLGNLRQAKQEQSPVRSNSSWLGSGFVATVALQATEVGSVVCVPVQIGDILGSVRLALGATEGKKVETGFAALYIGSGTEPKGIMKAGSTTAPVQSKSAKLTSENGKGELDTAGKPVKEHRLTFTLEEAVTITAAMAPKGFIYVLIAMEAETMPTATGVLAKAEAHVALSNFATGSPVCLAGKCQGGLKTAAPEKLESFAAVEGIPLVALF